MKKQPTREELAAALEAAQDRVTGHPEQLNLVEVADYAKGEIERARVANLARTIGADWSQSAHYRACTLALVLEPALQNLIVLSQLLESSPEVADARQTMAPLIQAREDARTALFEFDQAAERARQALRDALESAQAKALGSPEIVRLREQVQAVCGNPANPAPQAPPLPVWDAVGDRKPAA